MPGRGRRRAAETLPVPSSGLDDMRRSDVTGPPFWLSPVWSRPATCRPSISAAIPTIWLTVTTPVPPMPIMRSVKSSASKTGSGAGSATSGARTSGLACLPGTTVTKDGQSPSRQE